jgi:hypothetical protein
VPAGNYSVQAREGEDGVGGRWHKGKGGGVGGAVEGVGVERSQLGESLNRERQQISDLQSYIILLKQ